MTRRLLPAAVVASLALFVALGGDDPAPTPLPAAFERGAVVTAWSPAGYAGAPARAALDALRAAGATRAAVVVTWYVRDGRDAVVRRDPARTPSAASLLAVMRAARAAGLQVALKPHVDVEDGSPRAELEPRDRTRFMARYRRLVSELADLGRRGGADLLVVGTELTALGGDEAAWRSLIAAARARFPGRLTFAANWDAVERVGFWDALDLIGVDAYHPLATGDRRPTVAALVAAWRRHLTPLAALAARTGRSVLVAEVGYQSRATAAARPWDARGAHDPELQRRLYEAALRAWGSQSWVAGMHFWDWPAELPARDGGFSPRGKPAQRVLERWFAH